MRRHSMARAAAAGLGASIGMVLFAVVAGGIHLPHLDWSQTLSKTLGHPLFGYALFFALGVLVALTFALLFHDRLPGDSWRRGFLFAVMLWILTCAALAPLLGMGFFMNSVAASLGTLAGYLCYGGILGYLCDV